MEYVFTNGSAEQKKLWLVGPHMLMNMPFDQIPLSATVTFKPPEEVHNQTAFAETVWTFGSSEGDMYVRNDAPGFADADAGLIAEAASYGLRYGAIKHFNETSVHELAHAVFAAIAAKYRLAIARLFGALSASPSELYPADADWHDRIGEGIADTFKEAFLPARHRIFPNRTNRKIPYTKFPAFRRLIREGLSALLDAGNDQEQVVLPKNFESAVGAWGPFNNTYFESGLPFPADAATLALFGAEQELTGFADEAGNRYVGLKTTEENRDAQRAYLANHSSIEVEVDLTDLGCEPGTSISPRSSIYLAANVSAAGWGNPPPYPGGAPAGLTAPFSLDAGFRAVWEDEDGNLTIGSEHPLKTPDVLGTQFKDVPYELETPEPNYPEFWSFSPDFQDVHEVVHLQRPHPGDILAGIIVRLLYASERYSLTYPGEDEEPQELSNGSDLTPLGNVEVAVRVPGIKGIAVPTGRSEPGGQRSGRVPKHDRVSGSRA